MSLSISSSISFLRDAYNRSHGFTLVEILVTIVVLGVATVWAVPNLRRFSQTQTLTNYASDLRLALATAQDNAQSNVLCNNLVSSAWEVDISSSGYKLICNSASVQKNVTYTSSIHQITPSTNCSIIYSGNKTSLNCINSVALDSSGNLLVTLKDDSTGNTQDILVNIGK